MHSIGLMSGTSMDGVDAALLVTDGTPNQLQACGHASMTYPDAFKHRLKAAEYCIRQCHGHLQEAGEFFRDGLYQYLQTALMLSGKELEAEYQTLMTLSYPVTGHDSAISQLIHESTEWHLRCVHQLLSNLKLQPHDIDVIGYHGQTMLHWPLKKISVIVGDGQYLSDALGVTVVNNFRQQDIEAGGQGAPFAPLYHQALAIRDQRLPLAIVNCGGIANVSLIPSADENELIGFDTGPGNALIDRLVRQRTEGREQMDVNGHYAQTGKVDANTLAALYQSAVIKNGVSFFDGEVGQALDAGDMILVPELAALSLNDACRTLAAFTADSIISSVIRSGQKIPRHWILAGGGWKNPILCQEFKERLQVKHGVAIIQTADDIGWHGQALEAQIFAYLAVRRLHNQPISFPGTTGVPRALSGGVVSVPKTLSGSTFISCP